MLKKRLRIFSTVTILLISMLLLTSNAVYASSEITAESTNAEIVALNTKYSYVLEKFNQKKDHNSNMRFITIEELEELESSGNTIRLELIKDEKEFEKELLELANTQSISDQAQLEWNGILQKPEFTEWQECNNPDELLSPSIVRRNTNRKEIWTNRTHYYTVVDATVNDNGGYWAFEAIHAARTSINYNTFPYFFANSYNLKFLDARRTAAFNWSGYALSQSGVVMQNQTRYTENWANPFGV